MLQQVLALLAPYGQSNTNRNQVKSYKSRRQPRREISMLKTIPLTQMASHGKSALWYVTGTDGTGDRLLKSPCPLPCPAMTQTGASTRGWHPHSLCSSFIPQPSSFLVAFTAEFLCLSHYKKLQRETALEAEQSRTTGLIRQRGRGSFMQREPVRRAQGNSSCDQNTAREVLSKSTEGGTGNILWKYRDGSN